MTTVYKYSIPVDTVQDILHFQMPRGARMLTVDNLSSPFPGPPDALSIWAECDTSQPLVSRRFRVAGTGRDLNLPVNARYVGTAIFFGGKLVLHVYDLGEVS